MQLSIVPFYAALLAGLYIFLSVRVVRLRRQEQIGIGDSGNLRLRRAIRVHGNFAEYVPLAVILIAFVELQQFAALLVHGLCWVLIVGRLSHAYGLSQEKEDYRFRVAGMLSTFTAIGLSALLLIGSFLSQAL